MENQKEVNNEETKIIVFYVDVRGVNNSLIPQVIKSIQNEIDTSTLSKLNMATIVIPILGSTRIECINPKYIVDSNLIANHQILMKELHEHLEYQIHQLKAIKSEVEEGNEFFEELKNEKTNQSDDGK
jgi:hypothetical protein